MSLETNLHTALLANAGIAAIVGTRIYPVIAPDNCVFPAMVYSVVSEVMIGSGSNRCMQARVQIDCYATSYINNGVKAMRDALFAFAKTEDYIFQAVGDQWEADSQLFHQVVELFVEYEV